MSYGSSGGVNMVDNGDEARLKQIMHGTPLKLEAVYQNASSKLDAMVGGLGKGTPTEQCGLGLLTAEEAHICQ